MSVEYILDQNVTTAGVNIRGTNIKADNYVYSDNIQNLTVGSDTALYLYGLESDNSNHIRTPSTNYSELRIDVINGMNGTNPRLTLGTAYQVAIGGLVSLNFNKGTYSQATSITTSVSCTGNESAFQITTQVTTLASASAATFAISNTSIGTSSYVLVNVVSYTGIYLTNGIPIINVSGIASGTCNCIISNAGANALNGSFVLQFIIC